MEKRKWYKLDNVGKFYSSIADKQTPKVFRYSATIKEEIDEKTLQKALDDTIISYPNFNVNLKKGIFWYYLDETNKKYRVTKENMPICFKLYNSSNDFLYRISYYKKRINFEVSHIITDGRGSVDFFTTLVSNYIKLKYHLLQVNVLTNSYISQEEDSFSKYYKKNKTDIKREKKTNKIYSYRGRKLKNRTRYFETHMPLKDVLQLAHHYKATLTSFIVSVLIYSFKDCMSEEDFKKSIKIDLPVDLRKYFKSSSSRNYFGLSSISYQFQSREDSLDDIIKEVNQQFKNNLTPEKLSARVNQMVAFEKNIFCRIAPIFLKNIVLKIINLFTSRMNTTCVSNIGIITFEKEFLPYIENINILTSTTNFQFTLCSFKDDLSLTISSKYRYNEVIKNFCNYFSHQGIEMMMNVNEVD